MKETGIIMSGYHPRKILDGTKTMTRRAWGLEWINLAPAAWEFLRMEGDKGVFKLIIGSDLPSVYAKLANVPRGSYPLIRGESPNLEVYIKCPYGGVGDKLWCKETTWRGKPITKPIYDADLTDDVRADMWDEGWRKFPSIFMPRGASRIDRVITGLRAERLQEISGEDALAEGIVRQTDKGNNIFWYEVSGEYHGNTQAITPSQSFAQLWDSLNAKRGYGWEGNWWVWKISW